MTIKKDIPFALKMQKYAIEQVYSIFFPYGVEIIHLDDDTKDSLKKVLDISGADKLVKWPNGTSSFLAQRIRRYEKRDFDDFTLRYNRPTTGYRAEYFKTKEAFKTNKLCAAHYAYGHANKEENGFLRFRILDFIKFLEYGEKDLLPKSGKFWNEDNSSTFLAWPFKDLPKDCILYELINEPIEPIPLLSKFLGVSP